jgi:ABC-2 type transport system ATP-binding protein
VVEVTVDNGPVDAMEALRSLDQAGITPTTFTLREPSLDDAFLALTGHRTEGGDGEDGSEAKGSGGTRDRAGQPESTPIPVGGNR